MDSEDVAMVLKDIKLIFSRSVPDWLPLILVSEMLLKALLILTAL